jgi:hypothetical protein
MFGFASHHIMDGLCSLSSIDDFYPFPNNTLLFISLYTMAIVKRKDYKRIVSHPLFSPVHCGKYRSKFDFKFLY